MTTETTHVKAAQDFQPLYSHHLPTTPQLAISRAPNHTFLSIVRGTVGGYYGHCSGNSLPEK